MSILNGLPEETLSAEQELVASQEDLVLFSLREAYNYGKGCWQSKGLSDGETLSACYDGLEAAARNYEPVQGRFFTYAKIYVRGALSRAIRANEVVKKSAVEQLQSEQPDEENQTECEVPKQTFMPPHELPDHEGLIARDEWDRLEPLLQKTLSSRARMVLELHYVGGLSPREIAKLLGVCGEAIYSTRRVALKKIRQALMEKGEYFSRP